MNMQGLSKEYYQLINSLVNEYIYIFNKVQNKTLQNQ